MKGCQQITEEIEKGYVTRLTTKERLGIRMHVMICPPCRQYFKDSATIDKLLARKFKQPKKYKFSLEEKESMKKKLG